jgi:hypothetical protein
VKIAVRSRNALNNLHDLPYKHEHSGQNAHPTPISTGSKALAPTQKARKKALRKWGYEKGRQRLEK